MKSFDLEAAKRGAAVCMRDGRAVNVLSFNSRVISCGNLEPVVAEYIDVGGLGIGTFSNKGGVGRRWRMRKRPYDARRRLYGEAEERRIPKWVNSTTLRKPLDFDGINQARMVCWDGYWCSNQCTYCTE